jgi:hypothetical protein
MKKCLLLCIKSFYLPQSLAASFKPLCCYKAEFYFDQNVVVIYSKDLDEIRLSLEEYHFSLNEEDSWYWKKYFQLINN